MIILKLILIISISMFYLQSKLNKQCPYINYIRLMKKQKKHHTQQNLDKDLDRMLFLAAEEKLLPKIIYDYSFQHQSPKFANKYRQSVKEIYTKETALPLKYNEDDAKTHREKFRQKVIKLINNELPVDYLRPIKVNGKYIMTYKGQPLERVQYPTKTEYTMFSQYNQNKFKTSFENVFDDKLEYTQKQLISNPRIDLTLRNKTQPNGHFREKKIQSNETTTTKQTQSKQLISNQSPASLPKLLPRSQFDKNRLASPKMLTKKKPKRPKLINQQALILATMMKIGKYSNGSAHSISVTKQSIIKYFKQFYLRPHRIVDFLQFSDVETYSSFSKVPQRLKFMPNEHIYFMAFLFYDSNNDGYICNNDLIRMEQLIKKCPLIKQDHDLIRTGAQKIKFQNKIEYQQLYRLSQVTQTTYFNWLKKEKIDESNPESNQYNLELKQYFEYLNKRKIQVHYEGFKKIFENQKPYLYYDLVWRISGVKYEGLKYQ